MVQQSLIDMESAAYQVVALARALVLADNHFLSAAMGRLRIAPGHFSMPMATNGRMLGIDADKICFAFTRDQEPPKHDLLHTVLHCMFLHPYVGAAIDRRLWNLACDIAIERLVEEVCGPRGGIRSDRISSVLEEVSEATGTHVSAEKVYRELREGRWEAQVDDWARLFAADDHCLWYQAEDEEEDCSDECSTQNDSRKEAGESQKRSNDCAQDRHERDQGDKPPAGRGDKPPTQGAELGDASELAVSTKHGAPFRELTPASREVEKEGWRHVARSLSVNLQTYAKGRGKALKGLSDGLLEAAQAREDYADFLRQFAVPGEVLKVSDSEFDYVFYTYGLSLYGNLPLVEPLEYREQNRIREFVIVIDTSGSVWGETVQRFVDATFDVLKSTEAFFERVHVRIIQCDTAVRSDDVITNLDELARWGRAMRVHGGGGTDFRAAFEYVDALVEAGAFEDLGGLIYFTDGWGSYPEWVPEYKTAFVFYDESRRPDVVPPWAAQIVLDRDALEMDAPPR